MEEPEYSLSNNSVDNNDEPPNINNNNNDNDEEEDLIEKKPRTISIQFLRQTSRVIRIQVFTVQRCQILCCAMLPNFALCNVAKCQIYYSIA